MASSQKSKELNIDEDVDDLDDLIGQFSVQPAKASKPAVSQSHSQSSSTKPSAVQEKPPVASSSAPPSESPATDDAFSDEFAQEFAKGMESFLKEIGGQDISDTDGELTEEDQEKEKAFKAAWESLFMEGIPGAGATGSKPTPPKTAQPSVVEDSFQSRIKMTMDKLKESESTLKADSGSTPDIESLLSDLGKIGEGSEGDDQLQAILETMMSQLMSKEVLYEPLKELHDKFPSYLAENASKLSEADQKRYQSQQECVTKIVAVFENPKYSEDDPEVGVQIVTLMNEMQAYGTPPTEIMGDLPPGMNLGADGLPQLPEGCTLM